MVLLTRRQRRRRALAAPLPDTWRRTLDGRCAFWRTLSRDEQERLADLVKVFVADVRWEAARDFDVTDEMRVVIAAHACRLVLELPELVVDGRAFDHVRTIIVHPSTVALHGTHSTGTHGVVATGTAYLDGEAHHRGPVLLSWRATRTEALHPQRGRNVVYHEFAHQLDMLDGVVDGTPPIDDETVRARWIEVCTREFEVIRADGEHVLRDYAGTDPGEFFAVATEVFFTRGTALRDEHPELYALLADFYRQDPATPSEV